MMLSLNEFIGHFHPVIVHLPIGILLLALLFQWLSRKEQYTLSHGVMALIWAVGSFTALLSCITGYVLSLTGDYDTGTVSLHMWMGISLTGISFFICSKVFARKFDVLYKIASVLLLILIFTTGHYGGSLTHGPGYLTLDFPNSDSSAASRKTIANVQEAMAYADIVQPILESRCYSCHGLKKQKGGLRLDDPLHLMHGGKDGVVIIPGQAERSEMIKRLLSPVEEEHHMPPKEKPQLTEKEIALLHWWINGGADFSKKVKDLPQPNLIKPVLLGLQKQEHIATPPAYIPKAKVEVADTASLEALRRKGVVVLPVAQNSSYLMANFVAVKNLKDDELRLLSPLKKQLVWLKLSDTRIGDSGLALVAQCRNLRIVQLNNTPISDLGLSHFRSLDSLQSLSLVGTGVTANGLQNLRGIKSLRELYLFHTKAIGGYPALKKLFPAAMIDTGGYTITFLPTDTTIVKPPKH